MYLALRHQLMKNYSNQRFLETLQKEVNGIITDLNQTTETNVQIITAESEKLKNLQTRVDKRISEMQQIFSMLDRADGRYNEIIQNSQMRKKAASIKAFNQLSDFDDQPPPREVSRKPLPDSPEVPDKSTDEPTPREMVMGLYNQGRELLDIAERTHLSVGEVELIIELNK